MKKVLSLLMAVLICTPAFAKDVLLKNVPDGIEEQQVQEWNAVLIERFYNAKINQIPEVVQATEIAKTGIDEFRTANKLQAKFAQEQKLVCPIKPVEKEPVVEESVVETPVVDESVYIQPDEKVYEN
jgi:hypothetical protein